MQGERGREKKTRERGGIRWIWSEISGQGLPQLQIVVIKNKMWPKQTTTVPVAKRRPNVQYFDVFDDVAKIKLTVP